MLEDLAGVRPSRPIPVTFGEPYSQHTGTVVIEELAARPRGITRLKRRLWPVAETPSVDSAKAQVVIEDRLLQSIPVVARIIAAELLRAEMEDSGRPPSAIHPDPTTPGS